MCDIIKLSFITSIALSSMLYAKEIQIVVGSYTNKSNAEKAIKVLEEHIKNDTELNRLAKKNSLQSGYTKVGEYGVVTANFLHRADDSPDTVKALRKYYSDSYSFTHLVDHEQTNGGIKEDDFMKDEQNNIEVEKLALQKAHENRLAQEAKLNTDKLALLKAQEIRLVQEAELNTDKLALEKPTLEKPKDREVSVRKTIDNFGHIDAKEVSQVKLFKKMFTDGKVTGQIRSVYAGYHQRDVSSQNSHATAIGGMLKYELASLNGFNAGVALTTSQDINFLTGDIDTGNQNPELSSDRGNYSELTEAYINYKNGAFNLRIGRQMMDTPLADSDDIRMIPNTFEAAIANYEIDNFMFTLGNVQRWQGADTGLGYDDGVALASNWRDVGPRGTTFVGVDYEGYVNARAWFYDISNPSNALKATYLELDKEIEGKTLSIHGAVQYLNQSESDNSGTDADIYGALLELSAYDLNFGMAYNASKKHTGKRSFSGIGGGTLFTNMDTMIIDVIADDRDAQAIVIGLGYVINDWEFLYAYADFDGGANSVGIKEHIVEQNMGFEYTANDEFAFAALYAIEEDKQNSVKTENDWERFQVMLKYDF